MQTTSIIESWERLVENLPRFCPVTEVDQRSITLGEGALIRIFLQESAEPALDGQQLVAIHAYLAPSNHLAPSVALELSAKLPIGAIIVRQHGYELRQVIDLVTTSFGALDRLAGYLGRLGAALRRQFQPAAGPINTACFAMYTD